MLEQQSILVVEDDPYLALDLQQTVEDFDGKVVGPTRHRAEATRMVETERIAGAIIDCHVPNEDMLPLANLLAERNVPFVLHASGHLPSPPWDSHRGVPVLIKPLQPRTVLARLLAEMRKCARSAGRVSDEN